jgi:BCCT family betaine/carnitine transporter
MVAAGISSLTGLEPSFTMNIAIILIWVLFLAPVFISVWRKGSKPQQHQYHNRRRPVGFILIVGPTEFILNTFANSIGMMFQNYLQMSFYTDPISKSGFPQDWTAFYWAWWMFYVPITGLFIARISQGRTLRQIILSTTLFGS